MNFNLSMEGFADALKTTDATVSDYLKKFYPYWKMEEHQTAIVRFLPDRDENNKLAFIVANTTHDLKIEDKRKEVPCLRMYGHSCPICEASSALFAEGSEQEAKRYYKRTSYIGQVVVMESPFDYPQDAQVVKLLKFGPQIMKCIEAAFKSGDLVEHPAHPKLGYNFRLRKGKSGKWPDYGSSGFAPRQSELDPDLYDLIKEQLYTLSDWRAPEITRPELEAMLLADRTGTAVRMAKADPVESDGPMGGSQSFGMSRAGAKALEELKARQKMANV